MRGKCTGTITSSSIQLPHKPAVKHPLHRKLRLSAYINQQQADERLVCNLRNKFGEDPVLVMGNWSAPMVRYHEPIKGVGMRRMLRKHGLQVLLIDEFKTSSICPECNVGELKNFKTVKNPRLYKKAKWRRRNEYLEKSTDASTSDESADANASEQPTNPSSSEQSTNSSSSEKKPVIMKTVICHGLLYCTNEECFEPKVRREPAIASAADPYPDPHPNLRHWNRDTAAVLNFRHILFNLREGKGIPERFQRGNTPSPADQSKKPTKCCKKSTKKPKTQIQKHSG
ncbi:hypothetical protein H4R24_004679 [Coemansia sp. RSA 988]|nr:hypothetical protein H4R24_004679 [Coemansia sp. RSA 988]